MINKSISVKQVGFKVDISNMKDDIYINQSIQPTVHTSPQFFACAHTSLVWQLVVWDSARCGRVDANRAMSQQKLPLRHSVIRTVNKMDPHTHIYAQINAHLSIHKWMVCEILYANIYTCVHMYVYRYVTFILLSGCQSVGVWVVYLITCLIRERHSVNVLYTNIVYIYVYMCALNVCI